MQGPRDSSAAINSPAKSAEKNGGGLSSQNHEHI
jgi:hypothetical protein